MEPGAHYTGESGQAYFDSKFSGRMDLGRKYQTRYFLPFCSNEKALLDFGCGDGTLLRGLPAAKRYGVDLNPACREKIRSLNSSLETPIHVFETLMDIADNCMDVAISNHCLEHDPDPLGSLKDIRRVLKPEGQLVLVVPFDDWRQRGHRRWRSEDLEQHLFTWSPLNLGNLLTAAGFRVRQVRLCSTAWSPKFFWIHRIAGELVFTIACRLFSRVKQRREIFSYSQKVDI